MSEHSSTALRVTVLGAFLTGFIAYCFHEAQEEGRYEREQRARHDAEATEVGDEFVAKVSRIAIAVDKCGAELDTLRVGEICDEARVVVDEWDGPDMLLLRRRAKRLGGEAAQRLDRIDALVEMAQWFVFTRPSAVMLQARLFSAAPKSGVKLSKPPGWVFFRAPPAEALQATQEWIDLTYADTTIRRGKPLDRALGQRNPSGLLLLHTDSLATEMLAAVPEL